MNDVKLNVSQSKGYEGVDLIKVTTNEQGQKLVSARELYLGLGLNKAVWKRWYETNIVANEYFRENVDWVGFNIVLNGNETQDFAISLEFAKHIAMMARTEKSHEYRNYFIKCEKVAKQQAQIQIPNSPMDVLKVMFSALEEQKQDIVDVKQDFQNFKEEMPIFTSQRKEISKRVRALGVDLLGGKRSTAYQDKSLRNRLYSDIYGQIHREFGVGSCDDIKRRDYGAVFDVIRSYSVPLHLANDINYANNQMNLAI